MAWLLRDGEVLASLEVADTRREPPPGPARPRRHRRRAAARAGPVGAHARHALPDRRRLLRSRPRGAADRPAAPPPPDAARCAAAHAVLEAEAGAFARWGLRVGRPARAGRTDRVPLVLVGTPIGNLGDLSPRAVEALARPTSICCEDTRRTGRLLQHAGVERRPLRRGQRPHRGRAPSPRCWTGWRAGERVAVVTDAGMPGISDPGERLVRAAVAAGLAVEVVPGPVGGRHRAGGQRAARRPVRLRGLPAPQGVGPHRRAWPRWPPSGARVVLYEAPHRVARTLADLAAACGARPRGWWSPASSPSSTRRCGGARSPRRVAWVAERRRGASTCSCSTARRRPRRPPTTTSWRRVQARLDAGDSARDAVADGGRGARRAQAPGLRRRGALRR